MPYNNLTLPSLTDRPFFYTSFVQTVDGKAYVNKRGYWPIGSKVDYKTFTNLRAHADAIIDGKNTAIRFGKPTIDTLHSTEFKKLRKSLGKTEQIEYIVLTKKPDDLLRNVLKNSYGFKPTIFQEDILSLVEYFRHEKGKKNVFVDGGPHVIASFLREKLLDEIFLTIVPRIFGNQENLAITMTEGILLDPHEVTLKLISMEKVANEVFLHYKVLNNLL